MKALTREKYGMPDVLRIREMDKPVPKKNEVLVRVYSRTINRTDCGILTGKPYLIRLFTGLRKPSSPIPGTDFAGEVEAIGENVQDFKVGDRVWGLNDEGLASHAEYMTIREDKGIVHIHGDLSDAEAVACAEGAHYAYNFVNKVKLDKEKRILVNGATGAIGSAAIQILKSMGIYVCAVGNTQGAELVKSFGVDQFYNYEKEDFTKLEKGKFDFILDAVGKSSFGECKHLLLPKGTYISSELGPGNENLYLPLWTKIKRGKRVIFPIPFNCRRSLLFINGLIEKKQFRAVIDRKYQPEEITAAYAYVMSGQKIGNVILEF